MTALCRSIAEKGYDNICRLMAGAEMVEIRIEESALNVDQVRQLFAEHSNMLATCRPTNLTPEEQTAYLKAAIEGGAKWVDVEIEADDSYRANIIEIARKHNCNVIISYHNYNNTPNESELYQIAQSAKAMGADVVKLACQCNSSTDVLNLLNLYKLDFSLLAIGMGSIGAVTRIAAIPFKAPFTFVSIAGKEKTAPGQIDEDVIKSLEII